MSDAINFRQNLDDSLVYIGDQLDKKIDENTREMRREFDEKIRDLDYRINHRISTLEDTMKSTHAQTRGDIHSMEKSIINSITELKIENAQRELAHIKEESSKNALKAKEEGEQKTKLELTTKVITFIVGAFTTGVIGLIFHLIKGNIQV